MTEIPEKCVVCEWNRSGRCEMFGKERNTGYRENCNFFKKPVFKTKSTKRGQKYICRYCGKETLGYYGGEDHHRMHFSKCEKIKEA